MTMQSRPPLEISWKLHFDDSYLKLSYGHLKFSHIMFVWGSHACAMFSTHALWRGCPWSAGISLSIIPMGLEWIPAHLFPYQRTIQTQRYPNGSLTTRLYEHWVYWYWNQILKHFSRSFIRYCWSGLATASTCSINLIGDSMCCMSMISGIACSFGCPIQVAAANICTECWDKWCVYEFECEFFFFSMIIYAYVCVHTWWEPW